MLSIIPNNFKIRLHFVEQKFSSNAKIWGAGAKEKSIYCNNSNEEVSASSRASSRSFPGVVQRVKKYLEYTGWPKRKFPRPKS